MTAAPAHTPNTAAPGGWVPGRVAHGLLPFRRLPRPALLLVPTQAPTAAAAPDRLAREQRDGRLAALLAAAAAGDSTAFERFYDATIAHARGLARRMLRGPQREADGDDLLADSYFEAWRNLPRFDPARGSAVTWLLQIVRSRALDLLRRQAAHAAGPLADGASTEAADPAQRLWQAQAGTRLHAALSRLTPAERWVLGLAYFRDLSHTEIATATGLPLGTVKSHVQRAQAKLRAALAD
jgi:RNA polymerase sigma-70 factor, ECF subfamily